MRLKPPAIALLSLLFFLTCASSTQAATYTWTGISINGNNRTDGQNWEGGAAPNVTDNSPDTLVFPAGAFTTTMTNDLPVGSRIVSLVFRGSYVLNGYRLVLTEGIDVQVALFGLVDINAPLTLDRGAAGEVTIQTNTTLRLSGFIGGPSGLRKTGVGTLTLDGADANFFEGVATIDGGVLRMEKTPAVPSGLVVNGGTARVVATNAIAGGVTVNAPGKLDLGGYTDTISALNGDGAVELGQGMLIISHLAAVSSFRGVISGEGQVGKNNTASLVFRGEQTFTGGMTLNSGSLGLLNGGTLASGVTMNGGRLWGAGPLGALIAAGGSVSPSFNFEGPGVLEPTGMTLAAGVEAHFDLFSAPGGIGHDQIRVTGAVNLANANLELRAWETFVPFNGRMTLIDNDGTDPVIGTFANLSQGATFQRGDHVFHISYTGGTGNDVVVTSLVTEYHLSEGATGGFFDTDLLVANPTLSLAPIEVRLLKPDGSFDTYAYNVGSRSRLTIPIDEIPGFENTEVSIVVKSTLWTPLIVERTMRWDTSGYGAHTEKAVGGRSKHWYFAEGSQGFFSTYLLLANPNAAANTATVEFLREGNTPIVRTYQLAPNSRYTVDAAVDPDLVNQSFGMTVEFDVPGVAERSMYFGTDSLWKAGHESAGVSEPSTTWFLAEGATGPYFETFVLMANPTNEPADVTVTFPARHRRADREAEEHSSARPPDAQHRSGRSGARQRGRRHALHVDAADCRRARAVLAGSGAEVARGAQQFRRDRSGVELGTGGRTCGRPRGVSDLYPDRESRRRGDRRDADVPARRQRTVVHKTFKVPAASRFNVTTGPGSMVPELQDERFGVVVDAFLITTPIVVERAMYSNAGGVVWSAGTNATGTRMPITFP